MAKQIFYWNSYLVGALAATTFGISACGSSEQTTAVTSPAPIASSPAPTPAPAIIAKPSIPIIQTQSSVSSLIDPTSKSKRQEELNYRVNGNTNQGRDPFAVIPGSVPIPRFTPPTPPVRPVFQSVRPPVRYAARPAYTQPQPKPEQKIVVSGAVEIGGSRYAIISVPGDVTSRYVRAGDRIAGRVLVKRIEMSGAVSRVVLQQNGVESVHTIQ
jgi:hypothetical protein